MKIKKIIVDELPKSCFNCLYGIDRKCGKVGEVKFCGVMTQALVPDENCLLEVEKK